MNLESIALRNFKCFQELKLELHPHFNVLLGVNGTGKTSILEALRVAIGSLYLGLDKYKNRIEVPGIVNDDVRLDHLEQQFPVEVYARGTMEPLQEHFGPNTMAWMRSVETRGGRTRYGEATQILDYARALQRSVRAGKGENLPLLAYFSTDRYKKERHERKVLKSGTRLRGYYNALDQRTNIKFFLDLYMTETLDQFQTGEKSPALEAVNTAVRQCVQCKSVTYFVKQQEISLEYENGERMPFHLLSDGVRSTLAMVMEIAYRAYLLNPHLGADAPLKTSGVVLIDELDLHLHPEWQRHVANDLRRAFPNLQFVVTTHAPLIISSLSDCRIFSIADNQVYDFPLQTGRDANYILQQMDVPAMDEAYEAKFVKYMHMIEIGNGHTDEAKKLRKVLEGLMGANHAELKRADMLLSFY
jgi:predicted ATP-binding protein involved in virulence